MTASTPSDDAVSGDGTSGRRFSAGSIPPRVWIALVLLVVAVLFVAQNRDSTEIQVLLISLVAPLWAVLTVAVGVGLLIGLLLRPSERRRRKAAGGR
ncbi:LapA family protein [Nocardiopsis lambiniae]|uniref:LapA family protein n=1 Tax=Nocardiopsis lambiniae TaxID=3075539 RepID=A0ABU2MB89_9ACTN|nr:LapA family protein [Nocardiopsis sp. DSM 44743]MDT0329817.1 LapA family protein [Nocardiopsis sp. DSM 44743]